MASFLKTIIFLPLDQISVNVVDNITSKNLWNIVSKPLSLLDRGSILTACLPEVDSSTSRYRLWAERLVKRLLRAA